MDRVVRDADATRHAADDMLGHYLAEMNHQMGVVLHGVMVDGKRVTVADALANIIELVFRVGETHGISASDIELTLGRLRDTRGYYTTGVRDE